MYESTPRVRSGGAFLFFIEISRSYSFLNPYPNTQEGSCSKFFLFRAVSKFFYAEQDVRRDVEIDAKTQKIFECGQSLARLVRLIGPYIVKFRQIFLLHIDIIQFVTV